MALEKWGFLSFPVKVFHLCQIPKWPAETQVHTASEDKAPVACPQREFPSSLLLPHLRETLLSFFFPIGPLALPVLPHPPPLVPVHLTYLFIYSGVFELRVSSGLLSLLLFLPGNPGNE